MHAYVRELSYTLSYKLNIQGYDTIDNIFDFYRYNFQNISMTRMTTTIKTKAQANKVKYICLVVPTKKDTISHIIVMDKQTEKSKSQSS